MNATAIALSTTRSTKRKRTYVAPKRNPALVALLLSESGDATSKEMGVSPAYALVLEAQMLIQRADVEQTGKPGRPAVIWGLTDKGRKRAKRALGR